MGPLIHITLLNAISKTNVMAAAEPRAKYILLTDVVPVDEARYKFHNRSDTCLLSLQ